MSKSERLRLHDIRRVYELIDRISEFGDRPEIWRRIAIEGLVELFGGSIGLTADIRIFPESGPQVIDPIDTGWPTASARRRFAEYLVSGEMADDPGWTKLVDAQKRKRMINSTRRELIDDRTWYSSPCVMEARRSGDVDDFLVSSTVVGEAAVHGFIIYREWGDQPFATRHRRILQLFRLELTRAVREHAGPRPVFGELRALTPRLRQTLELMLSPMSLKEIADKLQLSRHTINDYQKTLYRIFEVNSRPALMCQFRPLKRPIRLPDGLV